MGLYVNPTDKTKEAWLITEAKQRATREQATRDVRALIKSLLVPVVLVDNGPFTALAVLYDQREADAFARDDGRAKIFAIVPRSALADRASGVGERVLQEWDV